MRTSETEVMEGGPGYGQRRGRFGSMEEDWSDEAPDARHRAAQEKADPERGRSGEAMATPRSSNEEQAPRRRGGFHAGAVSRESRQAGGWGAIELDEQPCGSSEPEAEAFARRVAQPRRQQRSRAYSVEDQSALNDQASLADRLLSAAMDGAIVWSCFLPVVLVFTASSALLPQGRSAVVLAVLGLGALGVFYGWLFMTWGGGSTPGMRYARIALCTFSDENTTRRDAQNRIVATALALLPLGLGVLWSLFDGEHLGWQDRMTKTYQRSYR